MSGHISGDHADPKPARHISPQIAADRTLHLVLPSYKDSCKNIWTGAPRVHVFLNVNAGGAGLVWAIVGTLIEACRGSRGVCRVTEALCRGEGHIWW